MLILLLKLVFAKKKKKGLDALKVLDRMRLLVNSQETLARCY